MQINQDEISKRYRRNSKEVLPTECGGMGKESQRNYEEVKEMKDKIKVLRLENAINTAIQLLEYRECGFSIDELIIEAERRMKRASFEIEFEQSKRDNVETKEKQFEVEIYYADGNEGARCTACLTEDKLKAILSGQSKEFSELKDGGRKKMMIEIFI